MKDKSSIVMLVVIGIAVALLFSRGLGSHPLDGQPAPPLNLPLLEGGQFSLEDHLGKDIVLLDFWATWCGPCRRSMPAIIEIAKEYADKNVVLYAVNQGEPAEKADAFIKSEGLDVTVALDYAWQAAREYQVEAIPQLVIVDKDGQIAAVHVGAGPGLKGRVRKQLDELLGKSL